MKGFLNGNSYGSRNVKKSSFSLNMATGSKTFRINVSLPVQNGKAREEVLLCEPVLKEKSKIVEVRYELPYSLDVEKNEVTGLPTW